MYRIRNKVNTSKGVTKMSEYIFTHKTNAIFLKLRVLMCKSFVSLMFSSKPFKVSVNYNCFIYLESSENWNVRFRFLLEICNERTGKQK